MEFISEQQQKIVFATDKYKFINGCAGSHKTDTLIKCAIHSLKTSKKSVQFLTLVGSVTYEIKARMESALKITLKKIESSNHYAGFFNEIPVCISNFDAWVHLNVQDIENIDPEDFDEKCELLYEKMLQQRTVQTGCIMKTGTKVENIFLDEAQDLCPNKMKLLLKQNEDVSITIAGDYLQTLFEANKETLVTHSLNIFKSLNPAYFDLNICMRCPRAHIEFNNMLFNDIQRKYILPKVEFKNDNTNDKPFLFTHHAMSYNSNARVNAEKVTTMISTLMDFDASIQPADVAIIMPKSNSNLFFYQLESILSQFYKTKGFKNHVIIMSTKSDGKHNTLDWKKAENKTILISIAGDKGKGHKVVFFLGLTENSIPRETHVETKQEILSESLLNVAITRSTKYLFIGFCYSYPSRYLVNKHNQLRYYGYLSWDFQQIIPEPYNDIRIKTTLLDLKGAPAWTEIPVFDKEYAGKVNIGDKTRLTVKDDISKDLPHPKSLFPMNWKKECSHEIIGMKQHLSIDLQEEHFINIGTMAELLIQRKLKRTGLTEMLTLQNVIFTDDERFLSFM